MARVYDRFLRQRLSRRRLLAGTGGAAMGAAVLAACGDSGGGSATPVASPLVSVGTPTPGGILHLRQATTYPNFNPFGDGIAALAQALFTGFAIFDHLWYVPTDTGEIVPFLGTDFEISDDGLTVAVTMGESVFHDLDPVFGRPVVAGDVKASIERFREGVPIGFSWVRDVLDRIEVTSDHTLVYHQNRPWFWFFTASNAGSPISSSILPEETLGMEDLLNDRPIGSGRYILDGHDAGSNVRLRKFPNWREKGLPYLDGVDYVFAPDDALAQANFEAKQIDSLGGLNNEEEAALVGRFGDELGSTTALSLAYKCVMITHRPPFDNPNVIHGINLGIDRQEMKQILHLGDGELSGPIPPAHESYVLSEDDPDLQEYWRFDPADGRAMLEAAGFPFEEEIVLKYHDLGDSPDLAEVLAQQLIDNLGLKIKLPGPEPLVQWFVQTFKPEGFQMTSFTHLPYEDPYLPMSFFLGSNTSNQPNPMGYADPEVDAAILGAASELDEEARVQKTKDVQSLLIQKWAPMLNFYSAKTFTTRWDYYKGWVSGRGSFGLFNSRNWLDK